MSTVRFCLVGCFALLVCQVAGVNAGNTWTDANGTQLWVDPCNWSPAPYAVPGILDECAVSTISEWPIIRPGDTANWFRLRVGSATGESRLIVNGGTMISQEWIMMGTETASNTGVLDMNDGHMTLGASGAGNGHLWLGFTGTGTLNMYGGDINVPNMFGMSWAGGNAAAYLYGGTIKTQSFTMLSGGSGSAYMDLRGGTFIVNGNQTGPGTAISNYINNGWIVAFGGLGVVHMVYDAGTGKTTITGVMDTTVARGPYPLINSTDAPPYVVCTWTPGTDATAQDIYFGTDVNAVTNATPTDPCGVYVGRVGMDVTSYDPPGGLDLLKTYYWRVDEVNEPNNTVHKATPIWSFKVANFALVDDFEADANTTIMLNSWANGGTDANLALSTTGGHDKLKAMKFNYNNADAPYYSEAQNTVVNPDWTISGVEGLELWYKGDPNNAAEQMYVALEDNDSNPVAVLVNSDPNAAKAATWQVWRILPTDFSGVNVSNVKKFYIGFGDRENPSAGGAGTVYIDDIRVYPPRCVARPDTDINNDCVVDFTDFALFAANWLTQL
jgi:hypothetical protein